MTTTVELEWPSKSKTAHTQQLCDYNLSRSFVVHLEPLHHEKYDYISQQLHTPAFSTVRTRKVFTKWK